MLVEVDEGEEVKVAGGKEAACDGLVVKVDEDSRLAENDVVGEFVELMVEEADEVVDCVAVALVVRVRVRVFTLFRVSHVR